MGLSVVTHSASDFKIGPDGIMRKGWQATRGLNRNCNYFLKTVSNPQRKMRIAFHEEWKIYFDGQVTRGLSP